VAPREPARVDHTPLLTAPPPRRQRPFSGASFISGVVGSESPSPLLLTHLFREPPRVSVPLATQRPQSLTEADNKPPTSIILRPVIMPAVVDMLQLVVGTISTPELAGEVFSSTLAFTTTTRVWFYMLAMAFFLVFIVGIAMTPWG